MTSFKRLVRLRILANLALGLLLICWPRLPFDWMHEAVPEPIAEAARNTCTRLLRVRVAYVLCVRSSARANG